MLNKIFPTVLIYMPDLAPRRCQLAHVQKYKKLLKEQKASEEEDSAAAQKKAVEMVDVSLDEDALAIEDAMSKETDTMVDSPKSPKIRAQSADEEKPTKEEADELIEAEKTQPWRVIGTICACWVGVFVISILTKEVVHCGSTAYWLLKALYIPVLLIPTLVQGAVLTATERRKELLVEAGLYTRAKETLFGALKTRAYFRLYSSLQVSFPRCWVSAGHGHRPSASRAQ